MKSQKIMSAAGGGAKQSLITKFLTQPPSASRATPSLRKPPRQPPPPDAEIISLNSGDEEPVNVARAPKRETEPPPDVPEPAATTHEDTPQHPTSRETTLSGGEQGETTVVAAQKRKAPPSKDTSRKRTKTKHGGKPTEEDPYGDEDHSDFEPEPSQPSQVPSRPSRSSSSKPKQKAKAKKSLKRPTPALEEEEDRSMADAESESETTGSGSTRVTRSARQSSRLAAKNVAGPFGPTCDATTGEEEHVEEPSASRPVRKTRKSRDTSTLQSPSASASGSSTSASQLIAPQTPPPHQEPERPTVDATPSRVADTPRAPSTTSPTRPKRKLRVWFLVPPPPPSPPGLLPAMPHPPSVHVGQNLAGPVGPTLDPQIDAHVHMPPAASSSQDGQCVSPEKLASQDRSRSTTTPPPIACLPVAEDDIDMSGSECDTDVEEEVDELHSSQDSLDGVFAGIKGKKQPSKAPTRPPNVGAVAAQQEHEEDKLSNPGPAIPGEAGDEVVNLIESLAASSSSTLSSSYTPTSIINGNAGPEHIEPADNLSAATSSTASSFSTSTSISASSQAISTAASTMTVHPPSIPIPMMPPTSPEDMIAAQLRAFYSSTAHLPPPISVQYKANVTKGTCKVKAIWKEDVKEEVGVKHEHSFRQEHDAQVKEEVKEEERVKQEPVDEPLCFDEETLESFGSASQTLSEGEESQEVVRDMLRDDQVSQVSQTEGGGGGNEDGPELWPSPRRVSRRERLQNTQ